MAINVEYVKLQAATASVKLQAALASAKLTAEAQYVLLKADTIVGFFLQLLTVNDTSTASDTAVKAVSKALTELNTALDTVAISFSKPASDDVSIADEVVLGLNKTLDELVTYAETFTKTFDKVLSDVAHVTDDVNGASADDDQIMQFFKVRADTVSSTDLFTRVVEFGRSFSDSATGVDTTSLSVGKIAAETSTTSDSGVVINQGYCDITYFAEDYVGQRITF